jgi:hypothetical protein
MINLRRVMTETPSPRWVVPPVVLGCSADRDRLTVAHPPDTAPSPTQRHEGAAPSGPLGQ